MAVVPGFRRVAGSGRAERYVNVATGEEISRRQYDKLRRPGFTNESLAELNRQVESVKAAQRPARGKSSLKKLPPELRDLEAERRVFQEIARKKREKEIAEQKRIAREIERQRGKKVKTPKRITGALLTPGALGRTIEFENGYPEYLSLYEQAKKSGKIFSYSIGVDGIDSRTGRRYRATVFTQRGFDRPISAETFNAEIRAFLESKKSYFIFKNYAMHLAFAIDYAKQKREQYGDRRKNKPGRKGKKK